MRARIVLLSGNQNGKTLSVFAEQVLVEVSAAFRHSFSLVHEKIGEDSKKLFGEELTQETVELIEGSSGALLFSSCAEDQKSIADALALPIQIRSYCVPAALCERQGKPVSLWIASALSIDAETLTAAATSAFCFAKAVDASILAIPPNGASRAAWEAIIKEMQTGTPDVSVSASSPNDAVRQLILSPHQMGVLLCPPYVGGILSAAADALCPYPALAHDASISEACGVYTVSPLQNDGNAQSLIHVFSAVSAVIDLLRHSLHLEQEAACVEAALNNVLDSQSWEDSDAVVLAEIAERICEQISVAGELMHNGSF